MEQTHVEEDVDFGCEERAAGTEIMAVVTLKNLEGNLSVHKFADADLYKKNINEGDLVIIDESGRLQKVTE